MTPVGQNEESRFSPTEQPKEDQLQTLLAQLMIARRNKDEQKVREIQQAIKKLREDPDIIAGTKRQTDQVKNADR